MSMCSTSLCWIGLVTRLRACSSFYESTNIIISDTILYRVVLLCLFCGIRRRRQLWTMRALRLSACSTRSSMNSVRLMSNAHWTSTPNTSGKTLTIATSGFIRTWARSIAILIDGKPDLYNTQTQISCYMYGNWTIFMQIFFVIIATMFYLIHAGRSTMVCTVLVLPGPRLPMTWLWGKCLEHWIVLKAFCLHTATSLETPSLRLMLDSSPPLLGSTLSTMYILRWARRYSYVSLRAAYRQLIPLSHCQ